MQNNISTIILAAGNSSRMGSPKPFLLWKDKTTFLEKIVSEYKKFKCKNIVLVLNEKVKKIIDSYNYSFLQNVKIIQNNNLEFGRFYSLKIGLTEIPDTDFVFIQNIDNPFVNNELLNNIYNNRNEDGYTVPNYNGKGGHPILIDRQIINYVINTKINSLNIKDILSNFNRGNFIVNEKSILYNINTQKEYKAIID